MAEHCNRLESHHACSAQVSLAAGFLPVSLPRTVDGDMIPSTQPILIGLPEEKRGINNRAS